MATITYNIEITNNKIVTPVYYTNTITPIGKVEREITDFVTGDGYIDISTSKIGTLNTVFANSTNANLSFSNISGVVTSVTLGGQFVWEVPAVIGVNLINCRVSTTSAKPVDATITLIGV
jgi:hypothetical protein